MKKLFILAIMMAFVGVSADARPKAKGKTARSALVVNKLSVQPVSVPAERNDSVKDAINDEIVALVKELAWCHGESETKAEYKRIEPKLLALRGRLNNGR